MSDVRNYPKHFISEFIELYRSLPSLWRVKSKEYTDRHKKKEAYEKMIGKLKEVEPTADREMVIRKVNSLRSSYRKEKRKVCESYNGSYDKDVHTPKLWYYEMFEFLNEETAGVPLMKFENVYTADEEDTEWDGNNSLEHNSLSGNTSDYDLLKPIATPIICNQIKRENETDMPAEKRRRDSSEDEHDIFGRYIAIRLRNLPKCQRIYLEKIINDAIFEAELGNLSRATFLYQLGELRKE